jgi:hypothetical protein
MADAGRLAVLDPATLGLLVSKGPVVASQPLLSLTFSAVTPQLLALRSGELLVTGVSRFTPDGLIRRVTAVYRSGPAVIVATVPASLSDVNASGTVSYKGSLLRSNGKPFCFPISNLQFSQNGEYITLDGNTCFKGTTAFRAKLNGAAPATTSFHIKSNDTTELTWQYVGKAYQDSASVPLCANGCSFRLKQFTATVGSTPVVITPVVSFTIGVEADLSRLATGSVTHTGTFGASMSCSQTCKGSLAGNTNDFQATGVQIGGRTHLSVWVREKVSLLVMGKPGPSVTQQVTGGASGGPQQTPCWTVNGGFSAAGTMAAGALSPARASNTFVDLKKPLTQQDPPCPAPANVVPIPFQGGNPGTSPGNGGKPGTTPQPGRATVTAIPTETHAQKTSTPISAPQPGAPTVTPIPTETHTQKTATPVRTFPTAAPPPTAVPTHPPPPTQPPPPVIPPTSTVTPIQWSITLTANYQSVPAGTTATLTAVTNHDVSGTGLFIVILSDDGNHQTCAAGSACTWDVVANNGVTHSFRAYVVDALQNTLAASNQLSITWTIHWQISLSADHYSVMVNDTVTITAVANNDVSGTGDTIVIQSDSGHQWTCDSGATCYVQVYDSTAETHQYQAYVVDAAGNVLAQSNVISVTWGGCAFNSSFAPAAGHDDSSLLEPFGAVALLASGQSPLFLEPPRSPLCGP